ncbi:MAG: hypothetical protein HY270_22535 [Deltaproteobacteria bacterium]|nr:hypothetical protein [Deltaproteobacteria bacterium]
MDTEEPVARINRKLEGWSNYFRIGPVTSALCSRLHTVQHSAQISQRNLPEA